MTRATELHALAVLSGIGYRAGTQRDSKQKRVLAMTQPQVFISYQRADEVFARQVREHLAAHGVATWMDQYDIPVGAYWPDEIDKGLGGSEIVVGILSPDAVDSRNVKNEWDWAIQNDKRLVLLQHRPCVVPHRYVSINFIDATGPESTLAFAALVAALGVRDEVAPSEGSVSSPTGMTRHSARRVARRFPAEPALAGRDDARASLRVALDATLAGRGQLALVGGEAGIGKTILTNWLGWVAEEQGALVLTGGCYDLSTTPPYGPWLEILRAWPEGEGAPSVPDALRGGDAMARLASQSALFELAADFLATSSEWRPLVLVLEDLHWTDPATLDLLRHLVRPITDRRIMLVATYRDDEITRRHPLYPLLPGLAREANTTRLILPRLDDSGLRDLIAARYPLPVEDAERLLDYLQQQTEGNPFFSGEVLLALVEAGAIARAGDGWRLENLERVHVPDLVRQVIEGRLARLGDDAQRLLGVAAVIGHEVPLELWVTIGGADESLLSETLERAGEARIIEEVAGQPGRGAGFRFRHALIRETLYEGLSLLRRRALHRAAGEALVAGPRPDPDAVAHHFGQAGDPRAFEWLLAAGHRARAAYAWLMAAERFEQAAGLIAGDPGRVREFGWLQREVAVSIRFFDPSRAIRYMEEAVQAGGLANDVWLALIGRIDIGFYRILDGEIQRGVNEMVAVSRDIEVALRDGRLATWEPLPAMHAPGDAPNSPYLMQAAIERPDRVVAIWASLPATWLGESGRLAEARELAEQLAEVWPPDIESAGGVSVSGSARNLWGSLYIALTIVYQYLGQPDAADRAAVIALRIYESIPHHWMVSVTHGRSLDILIRYRTDQVEQRRRVVDALRQAVIRAEGAIGGGMSKWFMMPPILMLEGHWAEAGAVLSSGYAQARGTRTLQAQFIASSLAQCHIWQGRPAEATQLVAEILPGGPATQPGDHQFASALTLQNAAATVALDAGDLPGARAWIECHDRWLAWSGVVPGRVEGHLLWARYHQASGDPATSEARARQALAAAGEPRQPLGLLAAHRALGELLTATGSHTDAHHHLNEALVLADACQAPFELALTLIAQADFALATGSDASEGLTTARVICERLEARPALERITALEARIGGAT